MSGFARTLLCSLLSAMVAASQCVAADSVSFKGKTVEITVGYGAGGGNDTHARIVSRHLGSFLPGNPNIIVTNREGAGGIVQTNYMAVNAPANGLTIGYISRESALYQIAEESGVRYDMAGFQWLGGLSQQSMIVFVRRDLGLQSVEDFRKSAKKLIFGARATGGTDFLAAKAIETLGIPVKIVLGYGAGRSTVAFEQGEINAIALTTIAAAERPDWLKPDGIAVPIVELGISPTAKMTVPFGPDLMSQSSQPEVYSLINQALGLPLLTFAGPPSMPADVTATLSEALERMSADPDFRADAEKAGVEIAPVSGVELKEMFRKFLSATPDAKREFAAFLGTGDSK